MIVVDSSALIALVRNEPGADRVAAALDRAVASAIILAESLSKLAGFGYDSDLARADLMAAGLDVAAFGPADIAAVVALHGLSKQRVSLADRFCLALALDRNLPVLTGDRHWAALGLPLKIDLIR
jgi:ribonuclease VapC